MCATNRRDRGDDILFLTLHLASRQAVLLGRAEPHISEEAMFPIRSYAWPGNVRELENALARAVAMSQRGVILPDDLPPLAASAKPGNLASIDSDWPTIEELQRRYSERVLEHTGQNKTSAASILGVDRRTLQRFASREAGKNTDSG